ncbi:zinc/manganese transport system substrate-binding protein [Nocardiopsis flavescens]|uniref:Zinc/manganese transport system substrate-binding protein n=1 Tax=Nocardiopsis flavescens TaxID=758803 RepID=A0A1M6JNJ9_9ACTN|nr:zinc ABC transporter substrate-binding protein AztC [Nocardiopsis flavescens]SHJ48270.1 zinc/manganese transport system substrate-binding protein [Nocardiopsis flavescens]
MNAPRTPHPRTTALALAAATALTLTACTPDEGPRTGVVVTTNILGDLTRAVVGEETGVTVLMKPDADPHSFGVSAQEAALIEDAALVVHNGLGLEEGVARNVEAAEQAGVPTLAVGEAVDPLPYTSDESEGEPDPHFWTDPERVAAAVDLIADQVVEQVDGVDAEAVRANAEAYGEELRELDAWMSAEFDTIPEGERRLVTNHHVFGYLADRYGFEVIGAVIPSGTTLASPSASDLESLASAVEAAGVRAVFADSSQPDRLATVMAEQAGVDIDVVPLYSESLTGPDGGAPTYLDMMRANTDAIVAGLTAP